MCGIFGVFNTTNAPVDCSLLRSATTKLQHRGPDDSGYLLVNTVAGTSQLYSDSYTDSRLEFPQMPDHNVDDCNLAFGFRRLAIVDLSSAGHQPMSSMDKNYWIIFNGEIYNYLELRTELISHGYSFRTGTDTEVILAAYDRWGTDCLHRFNGMWGFAIWDNRKRQLFLARDRFGVKPLYYCYDKDSFSFASEIKALIGKHGRKFVPNDTAIYDYLLSGTLPNPQQGDTFFQGVYSLPPGHCLFVQPGDTPKPRRYYHLSVESHRYDYSRNPSKAIDAYRELFTDAVRLRLRADVPIGSCLSGGVDSSSIVCALNDLMLKGGVPLDLIGENQKTFSAVYESDGPYNETIHIRKVLQATGAEANFTYPTFERLRTDIEKLVWHQDEPFGSTSIFAQWCVMSSAREKGVTVLLDGQGADESLGGYRPFPPFLSDLLRNFQVGRWMQEAWQIQQNTQLSAIKLLGKTLTWQIPTTWKAQLLNAFPTENIAANGMNSEFSQKMSSLTSTLQYQLSGGGASLSDTLLSAVLEQSLPHLLRYEDRNSMAFGIEARVPFVDYRVIEYAFGPGSPWRIHQGWTKWLLRQAMSGQVPKEILWRKDKVGFETPETQWIKKWFQSEPDFFGSNAYSYTYLDKAKIRNLVLDLSKGDANVRTLWRWMNLELWLKVWNKSQVTDK